MIRPKWTRGNLSPDFTIPNDLNWRGVDPGHDAVGPDDYLHRWYILPRNRFLCVYLHRMMRDDGGPGLHDHPGANVSIVLRGGYYEEMYNWTPMPGMPFVPPKALSWRRPGRVVFRRATTAHRLSLPKDIKQSWSLFIVFRKHREWGFWLDGVIPARWIPWHAVGKL